MPILKDFNESHAFKQGMRPIYSLTGQCFAQQFNPKNPKQGVSLFATPASVLATFHEEINVHGYEYSAVTIDGTVTNIGTHIWITPRQHMPLDRFRNIYNTIASGASSVATFEHLATITSIARIPSSSKMAVVSAALHQFSNHTDDSNQALFACLMHHHIAATNPKWNAFFTHDDFHSQIAAAALEHYHTEQYSDHALVDSLKYELSLLLHDYTPTFKFTCNEPPDIVYD